MKKAVIAVLTAVLLIGCIVAVCMGVVAADLPFENLFREGFPGYTSDEGEILTDDFVSSKPISVNAGEEIWFGPCDVGQYFQLVGLDEQGNAVTDKIRGAELTVVDTFAMGNVIYKYTVPANVSQLVFSVPASAKSAYTISKTEISELLWRAYWDQKDTDLNVDPIVGQSSYYEISAKDKLFFGAITEEDAQSSTLYDASGAVIGTMDKADLRLVESFGGEFGIYCYTVPEGQKIAYTRVNYNADYAQYYDYVQYAAGQTVPDDGAIVDRFLDSFGVNLPLSSTVEKLSGKTALFLGDSITYGARDQANIYGAGGWAGRIGYYCGMDVTNNGVSGACITSARLESYGEGHYILNNLLKTQGTTYDYVILHGMFNDASENVALGSMQGAKNFDPAKADVTTFAGALELLFYQSRLQNPNAILGYIVNFQTERSVDQLPYRDMAIAICENWGIEYLNLYDLPGFTVEFDDGLHPSSAGYDSMYSIVANWMAKLDGQPDGTPTYTGEATVMSYNVFWNLQSPAGEPYADIADRAQEVLSLIADKDPDILMLQEVGIQWVGKLNDLSGYDCYGYTHKNGDVLSSITDSDEAAPILWKTDKYTLEDSGYFLTKDAGIVSNYPRCINWVVLKDKTTGGKLLVMNYHADPNEETVRNLAARLLVEKLDEIRNAHDGVTAIVGGDWNMAEGSTAYTCVVGNGLLDTRYGAEITESVGSYNAWNRTDESKYSKGDYVFMSEGIEARSFDVVTDDWANAEKTLHCSDHCPILVKIAY